MAGEGSQLTQALAHAVAAEMQLLLAVRQPNAARGLLRSAALNMRKAADMAEGLRETLPAGDKASRISRITAATTGGLAAP